MSRVAVLGQRDAVLGFKASGAVVFASDNLSEAKAALEEIKKGDFAILLITEDMASSLKQELVVLYESSHPVVTVLPDPKKPEGFGLELLRQRVERAVGVNILAKRED